MQLRLTQVSNDILDYFESDDLRTLLKKEAGEVNWSSKICAVLFNYQSDASAHSTTRLSIKLLIYLFISNKYRVLLALASL